MLTFNPPIFITPPPYRGESFPAVEISELNYDISYSDINKVAAVSLVGIGLHFNLWSGDAYTAAGEFTTADTDRRLTEILGSDPGKYLSSLLAPRSVIRFGPTFNKPRE
jgi:hypothetical protein